jgi:phosphoglycerate dehydrogenase-like enzyme
LSVAGTGPPPGRCGAAAAARLASGCTPAATASLDSSRHGPGPRDPDDPLLTLDNAICTPHNGYVTREEWELQFSRIFSQIDAYASGAPVKVVNPEALNGDRG